MSVPGQGFLEHRDEHGRNILQAVLGFGAIEKGRVLPEFVRHLVDDEGTAGLERIVSVLEERPLLFDLENAKGNAGEDVIALRDSALGQFFSPAEAAAIPTLLPRKALLTANSMVLLSMVLSLLLGGSLAPVFSRVDVYLPYWIAAGGFAIAGGLIALATIPTNKPRLDHSTRRGCCGRAAATPSS